LIETVTGVTLEEYFQENILEPLGVKDLGFWMSQVMKAKLSSIYLRNPEDETMTEVPHSEAAVREEPGTKVNCAGGSGCFGSAQEYSSKECFPTIAIAF
jgi:CubicO group peptidase (beta-lactamase class C family)